MLDDEERIAGFFETNQRRQQRLGIGRVQARRRLIEHVHHPEQVGIQLRGQPQALQLAGRERGRTAFEGQVAEAQIEQHDEAGREVNGHAAGGFGLLGTSGIVGLSGGRALGVGSQQVRRLFERQSGEIGDVEACELYAQRLGFEALAVANRALGAEHILQDPLLHERALGGGESVQNVPPGARKRAHVVRFCLAPERPLRFGGGVAGVHRHHGLLVGKENPVAQLLGQFTPGRVHVVAQRHENIALVLTAPGLRPGRHRPLADGKRRVGHHRVFRHFVHPTQAVAVRAGAFGRIGRKGFGVDDFLARRIVTGP